MNPNHVNRLQRIFRELFDQPALVLVPELNPAVLPDWDSVAMVQLVLATEQEFGLRFTTEEVAGIKRAGDLLTLVGSKVV